MPSTKDSYESEEEVDWLECISAIETHRGLLYFCDAVYSQMSEDVDVSSNLTLDFKSGTHIYSITAYNPFNKVTNRAVNEISNYELLKELKIVLPGCEIYRNFSYFPSRAYHFERGFTVCVEPDYPVRNHCMVIYSLAKKYRQAAFFKGVVLENGHTVPYVILVQGQYSEVKENLVAIQPKRLHPAFLHKSNHAVFTDLDEVAHLLYQAKDEIKLCNELYEILKQVLKKSAEDESPSRFPVVSVEGCHAREAAQKLCEIMGATYCNSIPSSLVPFHDRVKHSTVLFSAYKTLANHMQSLYMKEQSRDRPVITQKYWSNTAASVIADEVGAGNRNLPPTSHNVYAWPKNLLKPDATVLLQSQSKRPTNLAHLKLKKRALKKMIDESWVQLALPRAHSVRVAPSLVMDELRTRGIIKIPTVGELCPASNSGPEHDITFNDSNLSDSFQDKLTSYTFSDMGKPFWW